MTLVVIVKKPEVFVSPWRMLCVFVVAVPVDATKKKRLLSSYCCVGLRWVVVIEVALDW